jgi:RNA polymerase sigma-70 factor (ECF subfamily)
VNEIDKAVERIKNGNTEAFGVIYDEFNRMVASVVRKVGRCSRSEIDFHVNEVFFRVYKGIFGFEGKSKLSTYIYRIALNYCFQLSKNVRREREQYTDLEEHDAPVTFEPRSVESVVLEKALDKISPTLRSVVVLYYYENLSVKEVAEIEGISENAVKNRLFHAREKLKKLLGEEHNVHDDLQ